MGLAGIKVISRTKLCIRKIIFYYNLNLVFVLASALKTSR